MMKWIVDHDKSYYNDSNNNDSYSYDDNLVQYHYRKTGIIGLLLKNYIIDKLSNHTYIKIVLYL